MPQGVKRSLRVAELLKRELSRIIFKELKDPGIGELSITEVQVSDDLRVAKVYFASLDAEEIRKKTLESLNKASSFIRGKLGEATYLKFVPELRFLYDKGIDHSIKIEQILHSLQNKS